LTLTEVAFFKNFMHSKVQNPILCGSRFAGTTEVRTVAMLELLRSAKGSDVHAKFRENRCLGSEVIKGNSHTHV